MIRKPLVPIGNSGSHHPWRCTVQKRIALVFVALAALLAAGSMAQAQSPDPWIGTWKVNLAKSTYSPGPKPTVAATVKMEPSAGGLKTTIDASNPQGQPVHTETVGKFDGKDNPVTGAPAPNSTTAIKRINGRTFVAMGKVDGKPTVTTRVVVSADGKSLTATQTGKDAQGKNVNNVIAADKQ
jgi:hypothetical protein